jgi:hypothetical protein
MSSTISALFVGSIVLVLASNISLASATPVASISEILLPTPNITGGPAGEIQCYALPYGALGLISHLLTYWTIACVSWGRIPIWPKRRIKECNYDMFLAVLALCTCIPIASITVNRCRLSWHFVLICIWKLLTSVSLACITIHRCIVIRREKLQSGTADAGRDVNTQSGPEDVEMTADSQEHPHPCGGFFSTSLAPLSAWLASARFFTRLSVKTKPSAASRTVLVVPWQLSQS